MPNYSQIELIGHLGKDPEMKTSKKGQQYAQASMAVTNRRGPDESTAWYNLTMFGQTASFADSYLKKGTAVFISGEITPREYVHNGEKRMSLDVAVSRLVSLGRKDSDQSQSNPAPKNKTEDGYEDDVPF